MKQLYEKILNEGAGAYVEYELEGCQFAFNDDGSVELYADSVNMHNYDNGVTDENYRLNNEAMLVGTAKNWPAGLSREDEDAVDFYDTFNSDYGRDVKFSDGWGFGGHPSNCPPLKIKLLNGLNGDDDTVYAVEFEPSEDIQNMYLDLWTIEDEYEDDYEEDYEEDE